MPTLREWINLIIGFGSCYLLWAVDKYHLPRIWAIMGLLGIVVALIMYVIGLASDHSKDWMKRYNKKGKE